MSAKEKEFDPVAYIENAFLDNRSEGKRTNGVSDIDVAVPTIGEFLHGESGRNGASKVDSRVKFKKKKLSAPRPRRAKSVVVETTVDRKLEETWTLLPKNITFLSSFFDDAVTANYYRGDFKESRQDLIKRLLDPELSLEEVSRLLGVCPATVRRYTNRNWLGHHRTKGGQRRFRLSGVVKFVEEHGRHPED